MVALWRSPCARRRIWRMLPVYNSRLPLISGKGMARSAYAVRRMPPGEAAVLRWRAALHASAVGGLALPLCRSLVDAAP